MGLGGLQGGSVAPWRDPTFWLGLGIKKRAGQLAVVRLLGGSDLLSHFRSTIGAVRFNFSVRNGKRWNPHAITTLVSFLVSLRRLTAAALSRAAPGSAGDFYRRGVLHAVCVSAINPRRCVSVTDGSAKLLSGNRAAFRPAAISPDGLPLPLSGGSGLSGIVPFQESFRDISIARLGHRCPCTCNLSTS